MKFLCSVLIAPAIESASATFTTTSPVSVDVMVLVGRLALQHSRGAGCISRLYLGKAEPTLRRPWMDFGSKSIRSP